MGKLNINNGGVDTNKKMADIDERFGPYSSTEAADAALGGQGRNTITAGLTVGILTANAGVKEYWYQPNKKSGVLELIPKGGNAADNPTDGNFASFDENGNVVDSDKNADDFAPIGQAVPLGDTEDVGKVLEKQENGFGWVNKPVDGTTPYIDQTTKHWMIGEEDTEIDAEGKSAYQVYVASLPDGETPMTEQQWLASLKGEKGDAGNDAHNPNLGSYTDVNEAPTTDIQPGDYIVVLDTTQSPVTGTIYTWNSTNNQWESTGRDASQAYFGSGEPLIGTYIDDTELENPVEGSLAKAEDVMQLKAKLEGVTANETKVTTIEDWYPEGSSSGYYNTNKVWTTNSNFVSTRISVVGYDRIRFIGYNKSFITKYAYGFLNLDSHPIGDFIEYYNAAIQTKDKCELEVEVPAGAAYFVCLRQAWSTYSEYQMFQSSDFYCYIQSGDTVKDELDEMVSNNKATYGTVIQDTDYLRVVVDANKRFLFGIKKDGSIEWSKGVPQPVREALEEKVTVEVGKELIESRYVTEDANDKYVWLLLDNEHRILLSVDKEGNVNWSKGIPEAIKNYIAEELSFSTGSANIDYMRPTIKDLGIRMLDLQVDSNGYELPATNGQRECLKIAEEFRDIRIYWKGNVPGCYSSTGNRRNFYTVNTSHYTNGIPYSAVGDRQVGFCVSIYTFMTAANNPFSLLYTEDTSNSHPSGATDFGPRSAWGRNYTGSKSAGTYYGTICSHFGQYATGSNYYNITTMQKKWLLDYTMQLVQSSVPNIRVDDNLQIMADIDDIRIGDLVVYVNKQGTAGHCRLITSIQRDNYFKITEIVTTEALPNYASDVQVKTQTRDEFINYISGGGDNYDSERNGTGWLCRNLDIVKTKHNPSPMWIAQQNNDTYQYNNDICTYAGDKCVFKNGDLVVLNYNLNNASDFDSRWQGIRLYKYTTGYHSGGSGLIVDYNKQLVNTYLFADFDSINLENYGTIDASQIGHALVLGTELESGSYMACMFNGDVESEATMFEVMDISIEVSPHRKIIEVNVDKSDNVDEIIRASVLSEDLKTEFGFYDLTYNDNINSYFVFNVVELNKIQYNGSLISGQNCKLRLSVKNKYGIKLFYSETFRINL